MMLGQYVPLLSIYHSGCQLVEPLCSLTNWWHDYTFSYFSQKGKSSSYRIPFFSYFYLLSLWITKSSRTFFLVTSIRVMQACTFNVASRTESEIHSVTVAKPSTHNLLTYIILLSQSPTFITLVFFRRISRKKPFFLKVKVTYSSEPTKKRTKDTRMGSNNVGCKSTRQQCQICEWLLRGGMWGGKILDKLVGMTATNDWVVVVVVAAAIVLLHFSSNWNERAWGFLNNLWWLSKFYWSWRWILQCLKVIQNWYESISVVFTQCESRITEIVCLGTLGLSLFFSVRKAYEP